MRGATSSSSVTRSRITAEPSRPSVVDVAADVASSSRRCRGSRRRPCATLRPLLGVDDDRAACVALRLAVRAEVLVEAQQRQDLRRGTARPRGCRRARRGRRGNSSSRVTMASGIATCGRSPTPGEQQRGRCSLPRRSPASRSARRRALDASAAQVLAGPAPCTSRISATWPSPMIVAPAYSADALELLAERLDDDLLGVEDAVDDQAELPVVGLQHHDVRRGRRSRSGSTPSCSRRGRPAAAACRAAGRPARRGRPRCACAAWSPSSADQLEQADLRDRVAVAAALDDQRRDDRQGQRDREPARSCRWPSDDC